MWAILYRLCARVREGHFAAVDAWQHGADVHTDLDRLAGSLSSKITRSGSNRQPIPTIGGRGGGAPLEGLHAWITEGDGLGGWVRASIGCSEGEGGRAELQHTFILCLQRDDLHRHGDGSITGIGGDDDVAAIAAWGQIRAINCDGDAHGLIGREGAVLRTEHEPGLGGSTLPGDDATAAIGNGHGNGAIGGLIA